MVVCDESLDGVHLMLQYGEFFTDKYLGIITRTDESELLYGACDAESVTPTLLPAGENGLYSAPVSLTTGWYVIKAYQLSNATQTVCNFGPAMLSASITQKSTVPDAAATMQRMAVIGREMSCRYGTMFSTPMKSPSN